MFCFRFEPKKTLTTPPKPQEIPIQTCKPHVAPIAKDPPQRTPKSREAALGTPPKGTVTITPAINKLFCRRNQRPPAPTFKPPADTGQQLEWVRSLIPDESREARPALKIVQGEVSGKPASQRSNDSQSHAVVGNNGQKKHVVTKDMFYGSMTLLPWTPPMSPFWRTKSLDQVQNDWRRRRWNLAENYQSKHRSAMRIQKKRRLTGT
eukprot:GHVT01097637.1.p1 GENE.GHVT01097637.1~~GHVT01097637.1.p1  ORF type:complete len:207 (+),score=4.27 GHVT01097637.1:501-1121(+)